MLFVLMALGAVAFAVYRVARRFGPVATKLFRVGDDLGGWTTTFDAGVPQRVGRLFTRAAKVVLGVVAFIVAVATGLLVPLALGAVGYLVWSGFRQRRLAAERLRRTGMTEEERDLMQQATIATLTAMGLTSKGADAMPPTLSVWRKEPVTVGGKPIPGHWRYSFMIRPAAGRSVTELEAMAGRGLDASDDRLRDAINSTLAAARSRKVQQLRAAGLFPREFVLTTVEHVTRDGEKIGRARVTLWTTDPFRRPVAWPYPLDRPVIRRFEQPAPVGLLRNNRTAYARLNVHAGIMGSNGSGKSSYIRPLLINAAWLDCVIVMVALKGPRDYVDMQARFAGGRVITDPAVAAQVAVWAKAEIDRRNQMAAAELAKLPDLLIVIDEAQEMGELIDLWVRPAKLGRSARVWLKVVTQYAPSSVKTADGGISTMLLRELKYRAAGRIEGNYSHAQVTVSQRVTKTAGPHMIPPHERWAGVLFNNDGAYERVCWVTHDSMPGRPSDLAVLASHLPDRPADPDGFLEALVLRAEPITLPALPDPEWPEDGAVRAADGTLTRLTTEDLDPDVSAALRLVWPCSGKRNPPSGDFTGGEIVKQIKAARARIANRADDPPDGDVEALEACELLTLFLSSPLTD